MRRNSKRDQALDAVASVAKTWSEWRLGERATKSVAKGTKKASRAAAKARKRASKVAKNADASRVKRAVKGTPLKIVAGAAIVGGVGAAIAKKLKGAGTAEPLYTPPPPPGPAHDVDGGRAATESAVAASEKAVAAASRPAPDVTEPTVPDTGPATDAGTDADIADPVTGTDTEVDIADAGTVGDLGASAAVADPVAKPAVSAGADAGELEIAPAGDGHEDDSPAIPADEADKG